MYNLLSTHITDLRCQTLKNIYPSRDNVPVMKTLLQDSQFWSININGIFCRVHILGHSTFNRDWVSGLQTYSQKKCRVCIVHLAQNTQSGWVYETRGVGGWVQKTRGGGGRVYKTVHCTICIEHKDKGNINVHHGSRISIKDHEFFAALEIGWPFLNPLLITY